MTDGAKGAVAAMRRSHDEMVKLVEGLDVKALNSPSAATEWTVASVLSHLGSAAEIGHNTLTSGKADMDAARSIWDRWDAMAPEEQAANFLAADTLQVEALEALDDDALASTTVDVGFLPAPIDIAFFVGMRLSEVGLHRWDIEVAFDPAATVADYIVPFVLRQLPAFAGFFAKPIGKTATVGFETSDPARQYRLELGTDGANLSEGDARGNDADTQVTLPAEAFVRLTSGRLDADHTPASVSADGALTLDDLRRIFPGY
jgi:uncharacterized protein (TIGR03083 family)